MLKIKLNEIKIIVYTKGGQYIFWPSMYNIGLIPHLRILSLAFPPQAYPSNTLICGHLLLKAVLRIKYFWVYIATFTV